MNGAHVILKIEEHEVVLFAQGEKWWSAARRLLSLDEDERVSAKAMLDKAEQLQCAKTPVRKASLHGVSDIDMLVEVLGDVQEKMRRFEVESQETEAPGLGPFSPHHYHRYNTICLRLIIVPMTFAHLHLTFRWSKQHKAHRRTRQLLVQNT